MFWIACSTTCYTSGYTRYSVSNWWRTFKHRCEDSTGFCCLYRYYIVYLHLQNVCTEILKAHLIRLVNQHSFYCKYIPIVFLFLDVDQLPTSISTIGIHCDYHPGSWDMRYCLCHATAISPAFLPFKPEPSEHSQVHNGAKWHNCRMDHTTWTYVAYWT